MPWCRPTKSGISFMPLIGLTDLAKQQNKIELSDETKALLDSRLNDYLQNPNEVNDFDLLLDELEQEL